MSSYHERYLVTPRRANTTRSWGGARSTPGSAAGRARSTRKPRRQDAPPSQPIELGSSSSDSEHAPEPRPAHAALAPPSAASPAAKRWRPEQDKALLAVVAACVAVLVWRVLPVAKLRYLVHDFVTPPLCDTGSHRAWHLPPGRSSSWCTPCPKFGACAGGKLLRCAAPLVVQGRRCELASPTADAQFWAAHADNAVRKYAGAADCGYVQLPEQAGPAGWAAGGAWLRGADVLERAAAAVGDDWAPTSTVTRQYALASLISAPELHVATSAGHKLQPTADAGTLEAAWFSASPAGAAKPVTCKISQALHQLGPVGAMIALLFVFLVSVLGPAMMRAWEARAKQARAGPRRGAAER